MKNALRFILGFAIIFGGSADALAAPSAAGVERTQPWNAETSDLEPDASIIYGRLPNGLRYAIRPNHRPQNQVGEAVPMHGQRPQLQGHRIDLRMNQHDPDCAPKPLPAAQPGASPTRRVAACP